MSSQLLPATVADQAPKKENAAYKVQSNIWSRPPLLSDQSKILKVFLSNHYIWNLP